MKPLGGFGSGRSGLTNPQTMAPAPFPATNGRKIITRPPTYLSEHRRPRPAADVHEAMAAPRTQKPYHHPHNHRRPPLPQTSEADTLVQTRPFHLVWSGVVWSGLYWSDLVWSGLVWSALVWCGPVWSGVVCSARGSGMVWAGLVSSCLV